MSSALVGIGDPDFAAEHSNRKRLQAALRHRVNRRDAYQFFVDELLTTLTTELASEPGIFNAAKRQLGRW